MTQLQHMDRAQPGRLRGAFRLVVAGELAELARVLVGRRLAVAVSAVA